MIASGFDSDFRQIAFVYRVGLPKPSVPLPVRVDSRERLRCGNEGAVVHEGEEYLLRIARNEKLMLAK